PAASPHAALREPLPLHDGRGAPSARACGRPAHAPAPALPHRVRSLPLPHRVHQAGTTLALGADVLPVGRARTGGGAGGPVGLGRTSTDAPLGPGGWVSTSAGDPQPQRKGVLFPYRLRGDVMSKVATLGRT